MLMATVPRRVVRVMAVRKYMWCTGVRARTPRFTDGHCQAEGLRVVYVQVDVTQGGCVPHA